MPSIYYLPDERSIEINPDETILQTSLRCGVPHTHVCGGNARCTTCRIVILDGVESCVAPRNEKERILAERLHFDPMIRLACQTRITGDVKVRRLVLDDADIALTKQPKDHPGVASVGEEKKVTILFADIRGFTTFAERQLPYDVIHVLNRYFYTMGQVIGRHGGYIDNYMGDGLLALFGVDDPSYMAIHAVRAGLDMIEEMEAMQPYLKRTYNQELQIGIGIHCGEVVIGTIGDADSEDSMVIGDAVNFASRVESANKRAGTTMLVSEAVYDEVQHCVTVGKRCEFEVKGKSGEHALYEILEIER